jgi:hypothetical protein
MHPSIFSAALKHDVIAIHCPSLGKCSLDYGATVPLSLEGRVSDDVLKERVPPPASQEIWSCDQHTCCYDLSPCF